MTREQQMQDMMTAAFWRDIEEGNQPDNGDAIEIAKTYERAYQQGWRDADQHPHWIPVEEELPKEKGKLFLVCDKYGRVCESAYDVEDDIWYRQSGVVLNPTHWMPLPQAPRKQQY